MYVYICLSTYLSISYLSSVSGIESKVKQNSEAERLERRGSSRIELEVSATGIRSWGDKVEPWWHFEEHIPEWVEDTRPGKTCVFNESHRDQWAKKHCWEQVRKEEMPWRPQYWLIPQGRQLNQVKAVWWVRVCCRLLSNAGLKGWSYEEVIHLLCCGIMGQVIFSPRVSDLQRVGASISPLYWL